MSESPPTGLVTFGEALIRLTPPSFQRLEQAHSLDVYVGGAELNVAAGAARLGLPARWVSRLPENPLGRLVAGRAREQGVDVSHVQWARGTRLGLYFAELGAAPRATSVLYDRAGSAMCDVAPGTVDWRRVFEGARWFHTSGITPALSESAAIVTGEAIEAAKASGLTVSYDLNYRAKLWTPERARQVQEPLMRHVDVLITGAEAARLVFGVDAPRDEDFARTLVEQFGFTAVAMTLRENPRVWLNTWSALVRSRDTTYTAPRYEVEVVDPIGAGDAFAAGLIFGAIEVGGWEAAVRYGAALSALKHGVPGDFSMSTREEVEGALKGDSLRVAR